MQATSTQHRHHKKKKEPKTIRLTVQVCGRFRALDFAKWVKKHADKMELVGWVRENSKGDLDLELQGLDTVVKKLLAMLHEGPREAMVARVVHGKTEPVTWEHSFVIRR